MPVGGTPLGQSWMLIPAVLATAVIGLIWLLRRALERIAPPSRRGGNDA